MNSKTVDVAAGIALCLFSVWVFWYAGRYTGSGVNSYGPDFFPRALSIIMFICACVLILRAVAGFPVTVLESTDRQGFRRAGITLVLSIAYLFLMQLIGFYIATAVFLYAVMSFLGQKGQVTRLLVSVIVASLIFGAFHFFLKIPLPEGLIYSNLKSF